MSVRGLIAYVALVVVPLAAPAAQAQTPRVSPHPDFVWQDERAVDRFVVQRWISRNTPDVSPAGFCECMTLVYEDGRIVLDLGRDVGITRAAALGDVTGDGRAELVITGYSGGAHCCESTAIYSVDEGRSSPLLSVETGNCLGALTDLDGDRVAEFDTCDDTFAYEFCAFAYSPMPPVVYAYDRAMRRFVLATPAFAAVLPLRTAEQATAAMAEAAGDPMLTRCAALGPALDLMYTGRLEEGQQLFRSLYRAPDAAAVERSAIELMRQSTLWMPK